jgi:DNA repair exonuclease SbcCD ATPase subunit
MKTPVNIKREIQKGVSPVRRLRQNEIKKYREKQWRKQNRVCPLCGKEILKDQAVLDHNHGDGNIRMVLHRQCNHVEGRILDWIKRTGKDTVPVEFLESLLQYWKQDFSKNPLHPSHLTENEKEIKKLRKRMRTVKRQNTKQKYRDKIKELQQQNEEIKTGTTNG